MSCCPTCGSRRGTQASKDLVRVVICWACQQPLIQRGPGRRRVVCREPACEAKRARYRKAGLAALDDPPARPRAARKAASLGTEPVHGRAAAPEPTRRAPSMPNVHEAP